MIVLIETPWEALHPDLAKTYLCACIRDSLFREEIPLSSHAMLTWTGALQNTDPDQLFENRKVHKQMVNAVSLVAFYEDHGWSKVMVKVTEWANMAKVRVVRRKLYTGG